MLLSSGASMKSLFGNSTLEQPKYSWPWEKKPGRVILLPEIFYFVDALGKAERHENLILLDFSKYGDPKEEHNHLTYLAIYSDCYLN